MQEHEIIYTDSAAKLLDLYERSFKMLLAILAAKNARTEGRQQVVEADVEKAKTQILRGTI